MRVDGPHQIFDRGFEFHGGDGFGNQLRRLRSDDVHAENLPVVGVGDDLDEPFMLANDGRARVGSERELPQLHVVSGLAGFRFGEANAADFRMAIGRARNVLWIDRLAGLACNFGDGHDRFHRAYMRQLETVGTVLGDPSHPRARVVASPAQCRQ